MNEKIKTKSDLCFFINEDAKSNNMKCCYLKYFTAVQRKYLRHDLN